MTAISPGHRTLQMLHGETFALQIWVDVFLPIVTIRLLRVSVTVRRLFLGLFRAIPASLSFRSCCLNNVIQ
jgi:hypothetical protein